MVEWTKQVKPRHDSGEAVVWNTFEGFFWFPRTLFGISHKNEKEAKPSHIIP